MRIKTIDRPFEDYSTAPPLEPWIQEELTRVFGLNRFNGPNMKIVWGGNERERKPDGRWGLKYWMPNRGFVTNNPVQVGSVFLVTQERIQVGTPRWIVERFHPPEKLDPSGQALYPRGRYDYYYEVEDLQGNYRAPGRDTIEHVRECMIAQDEDDKKLDADLQKMIDEDNAPVGHVIGSNYITPEVYKEI